MLASAPRTVTANTEACPFLIARNDVRGVSQCYCIYNFQKRRMPGFSDRWLFDSEQESLLSASASLKPSPTRACTLSRALLILCLTPLLLFGEKSITNSRRGRRYGCTEAEQSRLGKQRRKHSQQLASTVSKDQTYINKILHSIGICFRVS